MKKRTEGLQLENSNFFLVSMRIVQFHINDSHKVSSVFILLTKRIQHSRYKYLFEQLNNNLRIIIKTVGFNLNFDIQTLTQNLYSIHQ